MVYGIRGNRDNGRGLGGPSNLPRGVSRSVAWCYSMSRRPFPVAEEFEVDDDIADVSTTTDSDDEVSNYEYPDASEVEQPSEDEPLLSILRTHGRRRRRRRRSVVAYSPYSRFNHAVPVRRHYSPSILIEAHLMSFPVRCRSTTVVQSCAQQNPIVRPRTESQECAICLESYDDTTSSEGSSPHLVYCASQCGNIFHRHCISQYTQYTPRKARITCPLCRTCSQFKTIPTKLIKLTM